MAGPWKACASCGHPFRGRSSKTHCTRCRHSRGRTYYGMRWSALRALLARLDRWLATGRPPDPHYVCYPSQVPDPNLSGVSWRYRARTRWVRNQPLVHDYAEEDFTT